MRPRDRDQLALVVIFSLAACGAPPVDPGDPRGADATFHVSWRINGQDPADPSDPCAAAGVRFIRMNVVAADDTASP
ncbi:MAG: hypothetical protein WCJ30_17160, partial [Deltaproteobacteria bacterium]